MKINSINNQYNRFPKAKNYSQKTPNFKGGFVENITKEGFSGFYKSVANTGFFKKFIGNFSKSNNTFQHLLIGESIFLSGFYMINTLRNKKIEKEQKPQMLINDTLTLGVSTAGAYLVEDKIAQAVNNFGEKYFVKHSNFYQDLGKKAQEKIKDTDMSKLLKKAGDVASENGEKLAQGLDDVSNMMKSHLKNIIGEEGSKLKAFQITPDKLETIKTSVKEAITNNKGNAEKAQNAVKELVEGVYNNSAARVQADKAMIGFNKIKTLIIFGIIYRYLGPVVVTPIANKLSSKFFNKHKDKQATKTEQTTNKQQETKTEDKK